MLSGSTPINQTQIPMKPFVSVMCIAMMLACTGTAGNLYARGGGGMRSMNMSAERSAGGRGFVDANKDGVNDRARDADGDGIPNGRDEDFVRPLDGTGRGALEFQGSGAGERKLDGTGPVTLEVE